MFKLNTDQPAPAFELFDQHDRTVKLADYLGTWVVIYFYPKAMTPGCTTQACALRDGIKTLKEHNFNVVGISPDTPERLRRFDAQENLGFTLLSDPDHTIADTYGTWQQKTLYGKTYMGMTRSTFLVDPHGIIRKIWPKVDPKKHFDNIMQYINNNGL